MGGFRLITALSEEVGVLARTLRKRIASSSLSDEKGTPNPPMAAPMMFVITNPAEKSLKAHFQQYPRDTEGRRLYQGC